MQEFPERPPQVEIKIFMTELEGLTAVMEWFPSAICLSIAGLRTNAEDVCVGKQHNEIQTRRVVLNNAHGIRQGNRE
jgi:hypothetical protein